MHCLRDALEIFLIISSDGPITWFHMFEELKALGTNKLRTLGFVVIGPRVIHINYVINSYSRMANLYNLAQRSYLRI
jgi:uncharacterized protein YjeT (DUF2065 family)